MPKLVIKKYNGALGNWLLFWNKFEVEIDKGDLPAATKFVYLKELVSPMGKRALMAFPFPQKGTSELKTFSKQIMGRHPRFSTPMLKIF